MRGEVSTILLSPFGCDRVVAQVTEIKKINENHA